MNMSALHAETMIETELAGIQAENLDSVWSDVEPLIKDALDYGTSTLTIDDVYARLKEREYQLWIAYGEDIEALAVTTILDTPKGRVANIFICTGDNMKRWQGHLITIERWAKANECSIIRTLARPGWSKIMSGYLARHIELEKTL